MGGDLETTVATDIPEVQERRWIEQGLMVLEDGSWHLAGSECTCGARCFPRAARCAECLSEQLEPVALARRGRVHGVTTVRMAPPGFTAPYMLAWVDLDDGVRVFGQVVGEREPRVGDLVEVTASVVRHAEDGAPVHGHAFRPAGEPGR